jgi:hypothetical protein
MVPFQHPHLFENNILIIGPIVPDVWVYRKTCEESGVFWSFAKLSPCSFCISLHQTGRSDIPLTPNGINIVSSKSDQVVGHGSTSRHHIPSLPDPDKSPSKKTCQNLSTRTPSQKSSFHPVNGPARPLSFSSATTFPNSSALTIPRASR